ncbi:MAG: aminopeptidase P N-terminal domain-containing protein, partial [Cetobacterium sp.]
MFDKQVYISRRERLKKIVGDGLIIIAGNSESPMSYKDNCYSFIQDSTFLYYFGLNSPDLIGVIDIQSDKEYIFGKEFTINDIIWMGGQKSFKDRSLEVGVDKFLEIETLDKILDAAKLEGKKIHFTNQYRLENSLKLSKLLGKTLDEIENGFSQKLVASIIEMRNIKESCEI